MLSFGKTYVGEGELALLTFVADSYWDGGFVEDLQISVRYYQALYCLMSG